MTADASAPQFSEAALAEYRDILGRYPTRRAALMPALWLAQREFGWLSEPVQAYVAELMELPLAWVTAVSTFYTMYWKEPPGRWHLQVCRNLPCALRGADELRRTIHDKLGICHGEKTADGKFSLEEVECLASCGTAPVVQVNNAEYHENLDVPKLLAPIRSWITALTLRSKNTPSPITWSARSSMNAAFAAAIATSTAIARLVQ